LESFRGKRFLTFNNSPSTTFILSQPPSLFMPKSHEDKGTLKPLRSKDSRFFSTHLPPVQGVVVVDSPRDSLDLEGELDGFGVTQDHLSGDGSGEEAPPTSFKKKAFQTTRQPLVDLKERKNGCDRYGFILQDASQPVSASTALAKIQRLDSEAPIMRNEEDRRLVIDNYLFKKGLSIDSLVKTKDFKMMVRHGIPADYRARFWWQLSGASTIFEEGYYERLLKKYEGRSSLAIQQIELDVHRTLPFNVNFCNTDAPGIPKLRRILVAYSWRNPLVGYCQGMNLLVACLLLVLDEVEAFWVFSCIMERIMPEDYYTSNLVVSQADQRVLKELATEKFPKLLRHLESFGVDLMLITFNWFLTIYVDSFPPETLFRVWDCFLYEGPKVLFRFAMGILKMHERHILQLEGSSAIFNYLKTMTCKVFEAEELVKCAFQGLNPFPSKSIFPKRNLYVIQLQEEAKEVEEQRLALDATLRKQRAASVREL